jgi:hypothetical protein
MSRRFTRNVTTMNLKRNCRSAANEIRNLGYATAVENNENIVGADVAAGNALFYSGRDHIPDGTSQYDTNPI